MIRFLRDLATSTVVTAPSPATTGTTLTIETDHAFDRFPSVFPFHAILHPDNELPTIDNAEFVLVTGVAGDTFTIERGLSIGDTYTIPKSVAIGWRISLPVVTSDLQRAQSVGFIMYDAVSSFSIGDVLVCDTFTGGYGLANASSASTSEAIGVVVSNDGDFYEVITSGSAFLNLDYSGSGEVLFLSDSVSGALTKTEPTTPGSISKPIMTILYESGTTTEGYVNIMRGMEIDEGWGSTSFISDVTPAGLVNGSNTAYTVPEAYTAGTMEVFINGLKQIRDTDYTETNPTTGSFSMIVAPASGDVVRVNYMTGTFGTGNSDTVDGYHASQLMTPIGAIMDYGGATAPTGWLLCYGQAVSRTTYAALFAVLGTTYGVGDGSTTFNVPDIRGRVVAGQDDMGGTSANRLTNPGSTINGIDGDVLGGTGGAETHVLTVAQLAAHTHTKGPAGTSGSFGLVDSGAASSSGNPSTGSTGSDAAHNNVQPTIILNKIIRAL